MEYPSRPWHRPPQGDPLPRHRGAATARQRARASGRGWVEIDPTW